MHWRLEGRGRCGPRGGAGRLQHHCTSSITPQLGPPHGEQCRDSAAECALDATARFTATTTTLATSVATFTTRSGRAVFGVAAAHAIALADTLAIAHEWPRLLRRPRQPPRVTIASRLRGHRATSWTHSSLAFRTLATPWREPAKATRAEPTAMPRTMPALRGGALSAWIAAACSKTQPTGVSSQGSVSTRRRYVGSRSAAS